MYESTREKGRKTEQIAASFLAKQGITVIEHNYSCKIGEIDLVAREGTTLIICEVKYRKNTGFGYPEEAVDYRKQNKIRRVTQIYMLERHIPEDTKVRFDVISILGNSIKHIRDAF